MIDTLVGLRGQLEAALEDQQFHLLTKLDQEIKECIQQSMLLLSKDNDKQELRDELERILKVYSKVVARCEDRSSELKDEFISLKNTKNGADKYLDIASRI